MLTGVTSDQCVLVRCMLLGVVQSVEAAQLLGRALSCGLCPVSSYCQLEWSGRVLLYPLPQPYLISLVGVRTTVLIVKQGLIVQEATWWCAIIGQCWALPTHRGILPNVRVQPYQVLGVHASWSEG